MFITIQKIQRTIIYIVTILIITLLIPLIIVYFNKLNTIYGFQKKYEKDIRYNLKEYMIIYKTMHDNKYHVSLVDGIWFNKHIKTH